MGRISASTILLFISGILLSNHCINGQTTQNTISAKPTFQAPSTTPATTVAGVVRTTSNDCPSYVQAGRQICSTYVGLNDLGHLLASPNFDVCGTSLQQYACANLNNVAENTIFNILNCFITNTDAIVTQGAFSLFFNQLSINKVESITNMIKQKIPSSSITTQSRKYVLTAVWEKLMQEPGDLTPGSLAFWIQDRLYAFLPAITTDILNCITSTSVTCDGLEAIVQGLNVQYSSFSNKTKDDIGMWITKFIKAKSCQKDTIENSINSYYWDFKNNTNFKDFQMAFGNQNWSSALRSFTEMQVEQYVKSTNAFDSYKSAIPVLELLRSKDFAPTCGILKNLPTRNYNYDVLFSLLNILVDKLNNLKDPLCIPQLNTIFQGKLSYLLVATNETILQKLAPKDCSEFQAIYEGIDLIYDKLSNDVKQSLFQSRIKFLDAEAAKSGSACTYGINSTESTKWLIKNLGRSAERASYADLRRLNPNFDGYQAVSYLNMNQTIDMLIDTGFFTSTSPINVQSRFASVTDSWKAKGYNYTKSIVKNLNTALTKREVKTITIVSVRWITLELIWEAMEPEFDQFKSSDWQSMTESMSSFLPSIGTKQLSALSINVVKSCSNLRTIVSGIGAVYNDMNDTSISEVTDWISDFLRNESSHCTSGVGDWLVDIYKEFKSNVSVASIIQINPNYNLRNNIDKLASKQLGQFVMQDSEAHTNVTVVEKVFKVLTDGTSEKTMENLGNLWDGFNAEPQKADSISYEVKNYILYSTISKLATSLLNFTVEEMGLWFQRRFKLVTSTLDTKVLNKIPLDLGCGSQKSFIQAVSLVYNDTLETNKADIVNHIQKYMRNNQNRKEAERCTTQETSTVRYMQDNFGSYSVKFPYKELTSYYLNFNAFELGVFPILSSDQLGDMMMQEKVYKSKEKVTQVFSYLQTQSTETVDAVMTRFSKTGNAENIQIDNPTVGQQMLQSYFNIMKNRGITIKFQDIGEKIATTLPMLIQFFTPQTLLMFDVQDCDTLSAITGKLNKGFSKMTESTRTGIATWITSNLKSPSLNGCTKAYTNSAIWANSTMGDFFKYTTLRQAQEINPQLDALQIISETSIPQKVEYLMSSNALTDVNKTMTVLDSLKAQDSATTRQRVLTFLFNLNINKDFVEHGVKMMTMEVRQAALTYMLNNYVSGLNSSMAEQTSNFKEAFRYFIGGITPEAVQQIPDTINCDTFKNILSGINSGFDTFSDNVTSSVFNWIIGYMDYHYNSPSGACSSLYTDSRSFIQVMFQRFSVKATVYQIQYYYTKFNAFSCLDLLTGTHLGNLLANTTAITNQLDAAQILVEMKKRDTEDVKSFFTAINQVAQEKKITQLPDSNVRNMIFTTLKPILFESLNTTIDYAFWFGKQLTYFIMSSTPKDIASLRMNIDCSSQSYVVGGFSKVYSQLDDDQKSAMYNRIKTFNQEVLASTGSACPTPSGSSGEWLLTSWGAFSRQATLADVKAGNPKFNPVSSLNTFSGSQVADYTIQSGALNNESAITPVLDSIDSPDKAKEFLNQVNSKASEELQNSPTGSMILSKTFKVLSSVMKTFQPMQWKSWFQDTLMPILHNVDGTELKKLNYPMECASYQQVLTGLNNVFDRMSANSRQAVYDNFIRPQFDSVKAVSGVKCGQKGENPKAYVQKNYGNFFPNIQFGQFIETDIFYSPIDVITNFSPNQMADFAVSEAKNESVAFQVAARLRRFDVSDVNTFLDTMSATLKEKNMSSGSVSNAVGSQLLSSSLSVINNSLSSYSSSDWKDLVSNRLQPLFFSINSKQLSTLLGSADCSAYKMILQQLDNNYNNFTPDNCLSLFGVLNGYIRKKTTDKGFCPENAENSATAIKNSVGKFSPYMNYSQFKEIYPDFNWSTVNFLSPSQLASVTLTENVFTDQVQANALNNRLMQMSFKDTDAYLRALQSTSQKATVSIPYGLISQLICKTVFSNVSPQFASFSNSQWNDYFGSGSGSGSGLGPALMSKFLPFLQANQVQQIPETIDCMSYQSVISGFSSSYNELQDDVQAALYAKVKSYLTRQKELTGSACPTSGNSGIWLVRNLGAMSVAAPLADIFAINPGFTVMDAVPYLTPKQLGSFVANKNVLSDQDKINTILSTLYSKTIGPFMDSFNAAAKMNGITEINNAAIKRFLGQVFCKAESEFSSFTAADYSDFMENKLQMFISSLDAKSFSFIPKDIGCDSLAAIIRPLIRVEIPKNPTDVYDFVNSVLTAQKASTGSACVGKLDTRSWVLKFMGQYVSYGSWSATKELRQDFDAVSVADLLSATQRAAASVEYNVINNVTAISTVVDTFKGNITSLSTYMKTLRQSVLIDPTLLSNSKVKEVLLGAAAKNIFTKLNSLSASEVQNSMTGISFLLPSINATLLDDIPYTIGCPQFQAIVSVMNSVFSSLTESKKKDVANFIRSFLSYKVNNGDDSCTIGTSNTVQWVTQNIGSFCSFLSADDLANIFRNLDKRSYTSLCNLS